MSEIKISLIIKTLSLTLSALSIVSCGKKTKPENKSSENINFSLQSNFNSTDSKITNVKLKISLQCEISKLKKELDITSGSSHLELPSYDNCSINIDKFNINETIYSIDNKHTDKQILVDTGIKNQPNITLQNAKYLYQNLKDSAFLIISQTDKNLSIYISEFKGSNLNEYPSVLTNLESIKIDQSHHKKELNLKDFLSKNLAWRSINSAQEADYRYAVDKSNTEFKNNCKVHVNKNNNFRLQAPYRIHNLEKVFTESEINCSEFPYFLDFNTLIKMNIGKIKIDENTLIKYNEYLNKEVFLVFKKQEVDSLVPNFGLIKIKTKEQIDKEINNSDLQQLQAINRSYAFLNKTPENLTLVENQYNHQTKILEFIKNSYEGAKDSKIHEFTSALIEKFEVQLTILKNKMDEFKNN